MTKHRLLIAEDDVIFRASLQLEFEERGYEVLSIAREWGAAIAFAPDAAIVDLRLERESGMTLIRRLRDEVPACRIVVLTGYGSIASAVEAMKLGCVDYLTKPIDIDLLVDKVSGETASAEAPLARPSLARVEREYIELVLRECDGNISQAARELGIHRQSLQRKLRKYPPRF